jgi:hypothetical protein
MSQENNTFEKFLKVLQKKHLSVKNFPEKIMSWSAVQIIEFAADAYFSLEELPNKVHNLFTFAASSSFSGGAFPCAGAKCRLNNMDSLSRFAALYADRVYIPNPFEKFLDIDDGKEISEVLRDDLIGDLYNLIYAQPLFEAGLFSVRNNIRGLCASCLEHSEQLEESIQYKLDQVEKHLETQYGSKVRVEITDREDEIFLVFSGPEQFVEHGSVDICGTLRQDLVDGYVRGKSRKLTRKEIQKYGIFQWFIRPTLTDLFEQNLHVLTRHTQYLSNRQIDFDLIASVGTPDTLSVNRKLVDGIAHSIPDILGIRLENLLKLREKEGEAFMVYRDKLRNALEQSKALKTKEIVQLVDDEIKPELNKIENTIKNSRKLLKRSLLQDVIVSSGYITVGIFGGFLSPQAGNLVTAIGGLTSARALVEKTTKMITAPEQVLENPYYFLWKATK